MHKQAVFARARNGTLHRIAVLQWLVVDAEPIKMQLAAIVQQHGARRCVKRHRTGGPPAHAASLDQWLQGDNAVVQRVLSRDKACQHVLGNQSRMRRDQGDLHARHRMLAQMGQQVHMGQRGTQKQQLLRHAWRCVMASK